MKKLILIFTLFLLGTNSLEAKDGNKGLEQRISALETQISYLQALLADVTKEGADLTFPGHIRTAQDRLDDVVKSVAEGVIFINPPLYGSQGFINGQGVHLASIIHNPGFNNGNRFTVELRNNNVTGLSEGIAIEEINETNIDVWVYDSLFSSTDLSVLSSTSGIELSEFIDSAKIVVSHSDGNSISIEAVEVRHRLTLEDLAKFAEGEIFGDYRSRDSREYCVHKDVPIP